MNAGVRIEGLGNVISAARLAALVSRLKEALGRTRTVAKLDK